MEGQTEEILSSVLGDEFKIEVEKRDTIIKKLNAQIAVANDEFIAKTKEVESLTIRKNGLQDDLNLAYLNKEESFKKDQENFKQSIANSTSSLEGREKLLDKRGMEHDANVKAHQENVAAFNKEKLDFSNRKKAIFETLTESFNLHSSLLQDAIKALQEPYQEPSPAAEPKEPSPE